MKKKSLVGFFLYFTRQALQIRTHRVRHRPLGRFRSDSGTTIKEDVARIDVFSGDHAEDVEVLGTVRQGQFYLHAVIIGIGEDAVLRYVLFSAACFPFIVSIIRKSVGLLRQK